MLNPLKLHTLILTCVSGRVRRVPLEENNYGLFHSILKMFYGVRLDRTNEPWVEFSCAT